MSRALRLPFALGLVALLLALTPSPTRPAITPSRVTLHYKAITTADTIGAVFVMPGETLTVAARGSDSLALAADGGAVVATARNQWRWVAPAAPGRVRLRAGPVTLNAFVMVPATALRRGYLNGYRIGQYPARPFRGDRAYRPPPGFVEVTAANQDVYLTPHLQLGQFVTKQGGAFPRYVVLDELLLVKLELLLQRVQQAGYVARRFRILSGYRTPHYNRAIGNVTTYSRHVYGAAADIYIDEQPADGRMDDLNGDGRSDVRDAAVLSALVKRGFAGTPALLGGVSEYPATRAHGPFVHVDVRGYEARW